MQVVARRPGAGWTAALTFVVTAPLAWLLARWLDVDPLGAKGAVLPAAAGGLAAALLAGLALLRPRSPRLVGVTAGLLGSWVTFTLTAALVGTPYGYGGLQGDVVRLTAMATRYLSSWGSTDQFVAGVPAEYPPLFPWLTGHLASLLGHPAWSMVAEVEILFMSAGLVLAFMLWTRLVSPAVALVLVLLAVGSGFVDPRKSYEVVSLWVFVPWVLAALCDRRREQGGLHWLPGGVIGGLIVLTYQGYFLFAAAGLAVLLVLTWRRSADRRGYLLHCAGVAVTAFVLASWFLVPYAVAAVTTGAQRTYDYFVSPGGLLRDPLGTSLFLDSGVYALVHLAGLVGLVALRTRSWWARPLLYLLLGTLAYRLVYLAVFLATGHTGLLQYTTRLLQGILVTAAVLAVADLLSEEELRRALLRRGPAMPRLAVVGVVLLALGAGRVAAEVWSPALQVDRPDCSRSFALCAHAEPLPDGSLPHYSTDAVHIRPVPIEAVGRAISDRLGPDGRPVTVAYDERFLAVLPLPGWTGVVRGAANSLQRWDDRAAYLAQVAARTDPAAVSAGLARTPWGPIDALVLRRHGTRLGLGGIGVDFDAAAFDGPQFTVVDGLGHDTVLVLRNGA